MNDEPDKTNFHPLLGMAAIILAIYLGIAAVTVADRYGDKVKAEIEMMKNAQSK